MPKLFLLMFLIFAGCKQYNIPPKTGNAGIARMKKTPASTPVTAAPGVNQIGAPFDSSGNKIIRKWEFERYESKKNKVIGFWPECCGNKKFTNIKEYKEKWGFNAIVVSASKKSIGLALRNGYELKNILTAVHQYKSVRKIMKVIDEVNSLNYYIDEPLERGTFSPGELIKIANHIKSKRPHARLILGSYQKTWWFYEFFPPVTYGSAYSEVLDSTNNVMIMCDKYDGNQISDWKSFYETYGKNKIYGHFIHSKIDSAQYEMLLDTTNFPLDTKRIFYFHGKSGAPALTPRFAGSAWKNGWLKKIEREFIQYFRCVDKIQNDSCSKYQKLKIIKTNNFRIVE